LCPRRSKDSAAGRLDGQVGARPELPLAAVAGEQQTSRAELAQSGDHRLVHGSRSTPGAAQDHEVQAQVAGLRHGFGALVAGFENFVRDHGAGLAKLSGVLKLVSGICGILSFVPVIDVVAAPLALAPEPLLWRSTRPSRA
jgi:hypothetical protein